GKLVSDPEDEINNVKQQVNSSVSGLNLASTSSEGPRGILNDLVVECIDNKNGNEITVKEFNEQEVYRNFSTPRGLALIINNRNFTQMAERVGTDIDEHNLKNLFTQLGYRISVVKDLTAKVVVASAFFFVVHFLCCQNREEMLQAIQVFSKRSEHKLLDSCIVSVLTHGEHNEIFGIDDVPVSVHEFMSSLNALNCPALAHKPKIFILQACRGQRYDPGIHVNEDATDTFVGTCFGLGLKHNACAAALSQKHVIILLPSEADFLIAYATVPGYVSWRNSIRGSWFIQSLCEVFAKFSKQSDILEMMTLVNKRVAEVYESSRDAYKQVPECATRLRKKFFFFPGLSISSVSSTSI
uniref:CASPASE_P20 domain-containing protein n=1 Tax=Syphacia muris TaxID=451379 RepID=A0A0N5AI38_9BILA